MNVQELNEVTLWETAAGSMPAADHAQNSRHRKHAVKIDDIVFYGQETGSDRGTSAVYGDRLRARAGEFPRFLPDRRSRQ